MGFANQKWFDRLETKLRALGFKTEINPDKQIPPVAVSSGGIARSLWANGGIESPNLRPISVGARLVRFASGVLVPSVLAGEWWLDWDDYKIVERHADAARISIPLAVRELCCVPLEWNAMTIIVQVRVIQPLLGYEGIGAPATGYKKIKDHLDGTKARALNLKQLFIPGLSDPDLRRDCLFVTGYGLLPHELSSSGYFPRQLD